MVLPILNQQLKHLKYLKDQPDTVSIEVCKLVVEFLSKSQNVNRYTAIAGLAANQVHFHRFNSHFIPRKNEHHQRESGTNSPSAHPAHHQIDSEQCKIYIFLISKSLLYTTPPQVTKTDFEQALFVIFNAAQTALLWEFISGQRTFMANLLRFYNVTNLRYRDLEWRIESRIASRSLLSQAVPIIKIKLYVDDEQFDPNKDCIGSSSSSHHSPVVVRRSASRSKEILFQTDPTNLLHIIAVLEQALEESKTHRTKNFVKAIQ